MNNEREALEGLTLEYSPQANCVVFLNNSCGTEERSL
jgi:hypothetical protein